MSQKSLAVWRLKSHEDRRFRTGHPWVFSNELQESPKGLEPGSPVELRDAKGDFLARGYGNPRSLIAFRALTRDPQVTEPMGEVFFESQLLRAAELRSSLGLMPASHRLVFGESDFLPGLIIDRYAVTGAGQVFVAQAHTAGADRLARLLPDVLERVVQAAYPIAWENTAVIFRNDVGSRELEGLPIESPKIVKAWKAGSLGVRPIELLSSTGGSRVALNVDLEGGQKTAFYLDQGANIRMLIELLSRAKTNERPGTFRALDLCTYVGQWSACLAAAFPRGKVEAHLVDASQTALTLAEKNVTAQGASVTAIKADVMGGLSNLKDQSYDLVIADPPALIKGRKALGPGKHAYLQLNTDVFRLVKKHGWVVSCSCSGLLGEEEFLETLAKAARRANRSVQWVAHGGHAPDHPVLAEFPEGRYLKCWMGRVE